MLRHDRDTQGALEGVVLPSSLQVTMTSPPSDLTAFAVSNTLDLHSALGPSMDCLASKLLGTDRVGDVPTLLWCCAQPCQQGITQPTSISVLCLLELVNLLLCSSCIGLKSKGFTDSGGARELVPEVTVGT